MSSSLAKKRSIALSYGRLDHLTTTAYVDCAHELACRVLNHLWHNWGSDDSGLRQGEVDLYSVNIPLVEGLLSDGGLKVYWTTLWRNTYGQLFENASGTRNLEYRKIMPPDSDATETEVQAEKSLASSPLLFEWSPDLDPLINPTVDLLPVGSDGWAIYHGWASVTPLRTAFAESHWTGDTQGSEWKMKF